MARIAYILLCHKDPAAVIAQAKMLTAGGDMVSIHFDARAKASDFQLIRAGLADNPQVTFARRRIKCGWGEYSLVKATLNAIEAAVEAFPTATHFYMLSGDCAPIKSARYAHDFLDRNDRDFVESFDFFDSAWIKTGLKAERLHYRFYFNERKSPKLFYKSLEWQQKLGLAREIPDGLSIMIGSQWWCLRRQTIEAILAYLAANPKVRRFFATTWIPDETFFQTLVRHLIPETEIESRTLTFLMFTDYGMPVTMYDDHYDLLLGQDYLFARKISPDAKVLKQKLGELYARDDVDFPITGEGRKLFGFVTQRGRIGQRYGKRFWESGGMLGNDRELLVVTCKKWHVGKRLTQALRDHTGIAAVDYLFDEEATPLPPMGGLESTLAKRGRHRRAFLRRLYETLATDRLLILLDPSNHGLIEDVLRDRARLRLLEVDCVFPDDYLIGHARRIGLLSPNASPDTVSRLLPAVRNEIAAERETIRALGASRSWLIAESLPLAENARSLAQFLGIGHDLAETILQNPSIFSD